MLVSGCGPDKEPDEIHTIRAYYCGPAAHGTKVGFLLEAVGDFEPSTQTSEGVSDTDVNLDLPFPLKTRGVEVEGTSQQDHWTGVGLVNSASNIAFTLWPVRDPCVMYEPTDEQPFPRTAVGTAMGYLRERNLLLMAGSAFPDGAPSGALAIDLDRGTHTSIADIGTPLAYATITPFGSDALLVAGGDDPAGDVSPGDDARVFDARSLEFQDQPIKLKRTRSRHGAVTLRTGETLLVGGIDDDAIPIGTEDKATGQRDPVLELVSPDDRKSSDDGLAAKLEPRVQPTVLRLSDDRIFIGGGFTGPNPGDPPATKLEWLSPDATKVVKSLDVVLARGHAFAQLPGGAILAVGMCTNATPTCTTDPERPRKSATWIQPDFKIVDLQMLGSPLAFARLVSGADGSPWLFARTEKPNRDAWLVFDPWTGTFNQPVNEPLSGPIQAGAAEELPPPLAIDPGLFVWLEQTSGVLGSQARLVGFRYSTRNIYSRQVGALLVAATEHIAPSIPPPDAWGSKDQLPFDGPGLEFDQALLLGGPASDSQPAAATVADTTYADVDIQFDADQALPRVAFAGTWLGSEDCPWPAGTGTRLAISRRGTTVTLRRGGLTSSCSIAPERGSIVFVGPEDGPSCKSGHDSCTSATECCSAQCVDDSGVKKCARTHASISSVEIQRR